MIWMNVIILLTNIALFILNIRRPRYIKPTKDGKGIIIKNKEGKPLAIFDKPLK